MLSSPLDIKKMGCKFNVTFNGNINDLLELGRREAATFGGFVNGNTQSGSFMITALGGIFSGTYLVKEKVIYLNLDRKPFLVPCSLIEKFIKGNIT